MKSVHIVTITTFIITGCAETASNIGRATLAVGTMGMSEYSRAQQEARAAKIKETCAAYTGLDNIRCISLLTPQPRANITLEETNKPIHCDSMAMGPNMVSTHCN